MATPDQVRERFLAALAAGHSTADATAIANGTAGPMRVPGTIDPPGNAPPPPNGGQGEGEQDDDGQDDGKQAAPTDDSGERAPIPANWRDLPWVPREKGDLSLRSLAAEYTDAPVNSKADAVAAIEAHLAKPAE